MHHMKMNDTHVIHYKHPIEYPTNNTLCLRTVPLIIGSTGTSTAWTRTSLPVNCSDCLATLQACLTEKEVVGAPVLENQESLRSHWIYRVKCTWYDKRYPDHVPTTISTIIDMGVVGRFLVKR